ncbi:MAG: ROK family protein [Leptolinea sp.]
MKTIRTITATEMRGVNRTAVLELIRHTGQTSRTFIAEELKISLPTVMRIIDDLISEKFVVEIKEKEWSGGRKRSLVTLNSKERLTIGLDLRGTKFYGAVSDLGGDILYEKMIHRNGTKGEGSYALVTNMLEELIAFAKGTSIPIMGIGIGVPGVTFHDKGVVEWAPSLEWRNFPLAERVAKQFNVPVIVDNDVNLSALGEMWFGAGREINNLVVLNIGTGIGAGVVIDGAIYRGTNEMAGEIGYLIPGREYLEKEYPGFGALELLAAGTGIAQRARDILKDSGHKNAETVTSEDVFDAYRKGEEWSIQVVDDTVAYLAIAIAAVITFFDPEVLVLNGGVSQSSDFLIEPLNRLLRNRIPRIPPILVSSLGYHATVLGAMINLLHNISDFYIVRKLS